MFRTDSIYSLTDFQRNARTHLDRLKQSGQPEILTVNGQAESSCKMQPLIRRW